MSAANPLSSLLSARILIGGVGSDPGTTAMLCWLVWVIPNGRQAGSSLQIWRGLATEPVPINDRIGASIGTRIMIGGVGSDPGAIVMICWPLWVILNGRQTARSLQAQRGLSSEPGSIGVPIGANLATQIMIGGVGSDPGTITVICWPFWVIPNGRQAGSSFQIRRGLATESVSTADPIGASLGTQIMIGGVGSDSGTIIMICWSFWVIPNGRQTVRLFQARRGLVTVPVPGAGSLTAGFWVRPATGNVGCDPGTSETAARSDWSWSGVMHLRPDIGSVSAKAESGLPTAPRQPIL
jgi:hypothetical protein